MQMIDCLLINPGAQATIYGPLSNELTAKEPPAWCRIVAGYLRKRGHRVSILDAEAYDLKPWEVADRVYEMNPRVTVIVVAGQQPSASTQQMTGAGQIAKEIKKYDPSRYIIMMGNHPSALPERTLREEAVDAVIDGEGAVTLDLLIRSLYESVATDLSKLPGYVYWGGRNKILSNPCAPLIENLDADLAGNTWDLLPMAHYRSHTWQCFGDLSKRKPYASIYTTLGCPYHCGFCMINTFQHSNRYRRRSPDSVVKEIVMLHDKYGVETLKIADEMFILNETHYTGIAEGLIKAGIRMNIWAYARVDTIRPHTLEVLHNAGFRWLALGIESGSKHVRDGADKNLRNDDIQGIVRAIQNAGISVIGNYIFGLPDDTMSSMRQTLALACELNTEFANFYSAMAYPGSRLYDEAIGGGHPLPDSWSGYSQHSYESRPLDTDTLTGSDVLRFRDAAFNTYFTNPSYLAMIKSKFGEEAENHIKDMTKTRLRRKLLGDVPQTT